MVNKTKRFCAIALAALMAASVFAGCGPEESGTASSTGTASSGDAAGTTSVTVEDPLYGEGENGTINLKVWGPEAAQDLLKEQCAAFSEQMKEYGDIQIEVVPQSESDAGTQVLTDPTAAADVFGFACNDINKLVTAGALNEILGADKETIVANNSELSVNAATIDGKLYAYPETGDNSYCLIYDKSVVSDEQAKTLEGVLQACKAANKKFAMDAGNGFYSCMFLFTGGLEIDGYEDDGLTQKFTEYDEVKVVNTLKAFHNLFTEYQDSFLNGDASKVIDGFKSGTVGAGIDGSWDFSSAKTALGDNAGFATLPTINVEGEDLPMVNLFGYKLIGVNAHSNYPNTAAELAKYLTGEECQSQRAEQLNWGPSNTAVAESDVVANDQALSAILAQAQNSVPQISVADTFWTPFATLGNNVVDASKDYTDEEWAELVKTTIANVRDE